jgi:Fe-S cluster biogenesis protein NfuA
MSLENLKILEGKVEEALDEVRPHLAVDKGDVELVEITDDLLVKLKWLGTCENCSMSEMTMRAGIEEAIRSRIPQVSGVVAINGLNA